jgi:daunorubicin resistance ABC transporter membrane protein
VNVTTVAVPAPISDASRPSKHLGMFVTLWRRELLRLRRERSRWFGMALQPLLFWLILGTGLAPTFQLDGAPGLGYQAFFFPGSLVMVVLFTAIFSTITVIEDRNTGFLQGVLVAPGSRAALVMGKIAGITTVVLLQATLFVLLSPIADISYGQIHWPALILGLLLTSVMLSSIGMAMAWLLPTSQAYHAIMSVVLLPMWVISGALFPSAGGVLGAVMSANPLAYSVSVVRGAMVPALHTGWGSLGVLAAFTVGLLAVAILACRRSGGRPG